MKKVLLTILLLCLFFIPSVVKADTWLDDESYRDLSWFDASTYSVTTQYTIDTPEKMAGLLYLVNVEGYTFESRTIKLIGDTSKKYCEGSGNCLLDMTAHDWVPLKSNYKGIITNLYSYACISIGGQSFYCDGYVKIYVETDQDKIHFSNNQFCNKSIDFNSTPSFIKCDEFIRNGYKVIRSNDGEGTIEAYNGAYYDLNQETGVYNIDDYNIPLDAPVAFKVTPSENYYIKRIEVKDKDGNNVNIREYKSETVISYDFFEFGDVYFEFDMPDSNAYLNVIFESVENRGCQVIDGQGLQVGNEVVCGSEHFYILDHNDTEVKMLAKYNLLVGNTITREVFDGSSSSDACINYAQSKGGKAKTTGKYNNVEGYCFIEYKINEDVLQSSEAISAHWDEEDNYLYPQVGDVYLYSNTYPSYAGFSKYTDFTVDVDSGIKYDNNFYDLNVGNYMVASYLEQYKNNLFNNHYSVNSIDLLSLDEINGIVKSNNKSIPYSEWHNNAGTALPPRYEFGWLNDLLTTKQNFIYNTTYWLKTGLDIYTPQDSYEINQLMQQYILNANSVLFVDSRGGVCSAYINHEFQIVNSCVPNMTASSDMGAGIRPLVTISKKYLKFLIEKETDGNGSISSINYAPGDAMVSFVVTANKGFKLKSLIITSESGEEIEITGDKLEMTDEREYKISNNTFTMPNENVTIKAEFESNYKFIEGMNQEYDNTKESKLRFRVDMPFSDFTNGGKIFIDDEEIDCSCYDLSEGSTIIEFKNECSINISEGNHSIVARLSNGLEANTEFSVISVNNPATGDTILKYIVILLISFGGLYTISKSIKRIKI